MAVESTLDSRLSLTRETLPLVSGATFYCRFYKKGIIPRVLKGENMQQYGLKLRGHGMFGVLMIIGMFILAYVLQWNIRWWYFIAAIVLYAVAILVLTAIEESPHGVRGITFRWFLGFHLALMFLAVGLLLRFQDFPSPSPPYRPNAPATLAYILLFFIASVLGGLAIPFMVIKWNNKHTVSLSGLLALLLIILMFLIAAAYSWYIPWLYFFASIGLYGFVNVVLNIEVTGSSGLPVDRDDRFYMGEHLAFIFLLVGLLLHSNNDAFYIGFFIGGIAGGLIVPYLLFRK